MQKWEYRERMVIFAETEEGLVSEVDKWINGYGEEGWELVSAIPLIAPNQQGVAYGTVGAQYVFKRLKS
ncbi:MAG: hypothetical protein A2Z04_01345 [Chloroflexi bacterium RBG_16_57_9]|nr:MAG: hypothetical protein A2Z04_01345 [Chloroflexi bacterium RBG_16_57_9]